VNEEIKRKRKKSTSRVRKLKRDIHRRKRHPFYPSNSTHRDTEKDDKLEENGVMDQDPEMPPMTLVKSVHAVWATFPRYIRNAVVVGSAVINMRENSRGFKESPPMV
jgi:hypothetical protein